MPLVSVIIPCYNYAKYLPYCVESVLGQTFGDLEAIVIDDGSTDDTKQVVRRLQQETCDIRLHYIYQNNAGVSAARNHGIDVAKGDYIIFLDADDLWLPTFLEKEVEVLSSNKNLGAVYSWHELLDDSTAKRLPAPVILENPSGILLSELILINSCAASSVMTRTDLIRGFGGFDTRFSNAADWHMWLRLVAAAPFEVIEEVLVLVRIHQGSMSKNRLSMSQELVEVVRDIILRYGKNIHVSNKQRRAYLGQLEYNVVMAHIGLREWVDARKRLLAVLRARPTWWRAWAQLLRCIVISMIKV